MDKLKGVVGRPAKNNKHVKLCLSNSPFPGHEVFHEQQIKGTSPQESGKNLTNIVRVYSHTAIRSKRKVAVDSLRQICIKNLKKKSDIFMFNYKGRLDFEIIMPVIREFDAIRLERFEYANEDMSSKTNKLWRNLVNSKFPQMVKKTQLHEDNNNAGFWKQFYMKAVDEEKDRLDRVTAKCKKRIAEKEATDTNKRKSLKIETSSVRDIIRKRKGSVKQLDFSSLGPPRSNSSPASASSEACFVAPRFGSTISGTDNGEFGSYEKTRLDYLGMATKVPEMYTSGFGRAVNSAPTAGENKPKEVSPHDIITSSVGPRKVEFDMNDFLSTIKKLKEQKVIQKTE